MTGSKELCAQQTHVSASLPEATGGCKQVGQDAWIGARLSLHYPPAAAAAAAGAGAGAGVGAGAAAASLSGSDEAHPPSRDARYRVQVGKRGWGFGSVAHSDLQQERWVHAHLPQHCPGWPLSLEVSQRTGPTAFPRPTTAAHHVQVSALLPPCPFPPYNVLEVRWGAQRCSPAAMLRRGLSWAAAAGHSVVALQLATRAAHSSVQAREEADVLHLACFDCARARPQGEALQALAAACISNAR